MTPVYLIYRLDCGGYVLVDDEGESVHFETLGLLYAEISRCEEPYLPIQEPRHYVAPVWPLQEQPIGNDWKPWFAWKPVFVDGKRVWLRWVERIGIRFGGFIFHSYRERTK